MPALKHSTPGDPDAPPLLARRRLLLAGLACTTAPLSLANGSRRPTRASVWSGLPPTLRAVVSGAGLPPASIGLHVHQVEGDTPPLASLNAEHPYQLASTAKVVTALAALDLLGPHYRWRTYAFTRGPLNQGRLLGDLLIVGGGDAGLSSADVRAWFERMHAQGLREVWGDIVLDRYAFRLREQDHGDTPLPAPDRPHHVRPDALTLDEGVLQLTVRAGARGRPQVDLLPPLAGLPVRNQVRNGGGCVVWAHTATGPNGATQLAVHGQWSAGCGRREISMAPLGHDEFTVRAVEGLWREAGGRLRGRVLDKRQPDRSMLMPMGTDGQPQLPFSVHLSEPLPQLIREINKTSDNMAARNLMLSLVQGFPMRPATMVEARERVATWLRMQGLHGDDIALDNGSGLSRAERGKPRAMVQLLRRAWVHRQAQAFIDSLPVAGVDGTLAHRMTQGRATGSAFLKTGTLLDTRALAGYVRASSGRMYAVAALVNHPEAQRATPTLDAVIEWVARQG